MTACERQAVHIAKSNPRIILVLANFTVRGVNGWAFACPVV